MNKYSVKAAACALVGTLSLSGYQTTLEAKIHGSSDVPAAGVAVVMDEGSTIQDLQVEVVQNIAYLESASGLQPNIVLASEKAGLAEAVNHIVQSNPKLATAKATSENGQHSTTATDEEMSGQQETSNEEIFEQESQEQASSPLEESEVTSEQETSNSETFEQESSTEESSEQETSNPETSEQESSTEESSEQETSNPETSEQESSTEESSEQETSEEETTEEPTSTEDDFQTSAGFSATDTYDNVEISEEEETETRTDEQDFSGLVIARVTNYVNVRSLPSEEGEIVGKLYDKSVGEFIEEKDGWYKIVSENCTGYVKGEYCVVGEEAEALAKEVGTTYAVVNTTTLKVRKEASTESSVLGLVPIEEELIVVEELDGWVKIAIEEGDGYVSRDYVNLRTDFVHAESREEEEARLAKEARAREEARAAATEAARAQKKAETQANKAEKSEANQATIEAARNTAASSGGSEMGKAVIDYATQFVGNPYVYGGSSLTNGTDCSGFVMSVYANFGVSLPHSSSALRSKGYDVGGLQNAQPGDIVCYSGHVGLYVGNGQIVHASTSKTGIIVSSATYRNILTVRRIF